METRRRLARFGIAVGLALGSVALTLAAAELAFRALDLRGVHDFRWEIGRKGQPNGRFRHEYGSNPRGYFGPNNEIEYQLNALGFRGRDVARRKPPGVRRIVLLGDSFAFGEGVKLGDTFATRLEGSLGSAEAPVEVVNFSLGGWGTAEEIDYLERVGIHFDPDLVLVVFVLNDAGYAGGLDLWQDFTARVQNQRLKRSYLASWLYSRWARATLGREYVEQLVSDSAAERAKWDAALARLADGRRAANGVGARFAVALFPFLYALDDDYPFAALHARVADFCAAHRIAFVDLLDAFRGRDYAELWVHPSDQHPNERAHEIAAAALTAFISERNLLPPR